MVQVLIELDAEILERLEKVAPARSRLRSEFIRAALRKELWEIEERATREAYERSPDSAEAAYVDPAVWEQAPRRRSKARKR